MAIKKQFLITVIWQRRLERERERGRERENKKKRRNIEIMISTELMRIWEVNNLTIASMI